MSTEASPFTSAVNHFPPRAGDVWRWGRDEYTFTGLCVPGYENHPRRLWQTANALDQGFGDDAFGRILTFVREATPAPVAAPVRLLTATCRECHHKAGENCICGVPEAAPMPSTCPACGWSGKAGHIHRCSHIKVCSAILETGPGIATLKVTPPEPWTPSVDPDFWIRDWNE